MTVDFPNSLTNFIDDTKLVLRPVTMNHKNRKALRD